MEEKTGSINRRTLGATIRAATKGERRADYLHSSGYGAAQSGGAIGTTGSESFRERQKLERKRQFVRNYQSSRLGAQADGGFSARTFDGEATSDSSGDGRRASRGDSRAARGSRGGGRGAVSARQRNPIAERREKYGGGGLSRGAGASSARGGGAKK